MFELLAQDPGFGEFGAWMQSGIASVMCGLLVWVATSFPKWRQDDHQREVERYRLMSDETDKGRAWFTQQMDHERDQNEKTRESVGQLVRSVDQLSNNLSSLPCRMVSHAGNSSSPVPLHQLSVSSGQT